MFTFLGFLIKLFSNFHDRRTGLSRSVRGTNLMMTVGLSDLRQLVDLYCPFSTIFV